MTTDRLMVPLNIGDRVYCWSFNSFLTIEKQDKYDKKYFICSGINSDGKSYTTLKYCKDILNLGAHREIYPEVFL